MKNLNLSVVGFTLVILASSQSFAILGGAKVTYNDYKKLPLIGINVNGIQTCSAVLLNPRTLLTAAHCVGQMQLYRDVKIVTVGRFTSTNVSSKQISIHPQYNPVGHVNDFAIIKLRNAFNMTKDVVYPSLSSATEFASYVFYGYGLTQNTQDNLMRVEKPRADLLPLRPGNETYLEFQQNNGSGICTGDSGGPVFGNSPAGTQLIAINTAVTKSSGKFCTNTGVVSRLAPVMDWIKSKL